MTKFYDTRNTILKKQPKKGDFSNWIHSRFKEVKDNITPELQNAVEVLSKQINSWGDVPHLELEARLGYFDEDREGNATFPFDSDIGKEWFEKIKDDLDNDSDIIRKEETDMTDYNVSSLRLTVNNKTQTRCAIEKTALSHSNFRYVNSPFDVRVSFSKETPVAVKDFQDKAKASKASTSDYRKKKRFTYHTNHWKYELTRVDFKKNQIEQCNYQVEIEAKLEEIPYCDYVYMANSLLLKVRKLVNICEPEEEDDPRDLAYLKDISKDFASPADQIKDGLQKLSLK